MATSTEAGSAAVAAVGSEVSETQAENLAALVAEIFIAFDNDKAGQADATTALRLLPERHVTASLWVPPAPFHDVADMPVEAVVQWLKQREEEIDAPATHRQLQYETGQ